MSLFLSQQTEERHKVNERRWYGAENRKKRRKIRQEKFTFLWGLSWSSCVSQKIFSLLFCEIFWHHLLSQIFLVATTSFIWFLNIIFHHLCETWVRFENLDWMSKNCSTSFTFQIFLSAPVLMPFFAILPHWLSQTFHNLKLKIRSKLDELVEKSNYSRRGSRNFSTFYCAD